MTDIDPTPGQRGESGPPTEREPRCARCGSADLTRWAQDSSGGEAIGFACDHCGLLMGDGQEHEPAFAEADHGEGDSLTDHRDVAADAIAEALGLVTATDVGDEAYKPHGLAVLVLAAFKKRGLTVVTYSDLYDMRDLARAEGRSEQRLSLHDNFGNLSGGRQEADRG